MAEVVGAGQFGNDQYWLHTWTGLANTDTGRPVKMSRFSDKTVSVDGTPGTGGEVTLEGSQNGSDWYTLTDFQGMEMVLAVDDIRVVAENPRFIRPNVTGGDGTTDLVVSIGSTVVG